MVTRTQTTDAPGDIDYNFGENGKVFLNFRDAHFVSVWNMAFTQDRKILFVGSTNMNEFVIGCLTEYGLVDTSFGSDGSMKGQFLGYASKGTSVHVLNSDKLLVTGTYIADDQILPAASRLLPNGDLDPTFGNNGTFVFKPSGTTASNATMPLNTPRSNDNAGTASIVLPDGKILISHPITADRHGLLIRLTKDGVLDTGFNDTGYTQVRYPNEQNRSTLIGSFMVTPKREVVVCGQIELEGSPIMGMLARYGSDGRPDTTFGTEGTGFIALGVDQQRLRVDDLVADDNGGFVGIGTMAQQSSETQDAIIFGRMVNGEPDPNFNNGEITGIDLQVNSEWYSAARVPVDNTIVATGITFDKNFENQGIIVGRYLKSGPLDVNFGDGNGWKILDPGQEPRLLLQDDKILVCYVSRVASERGCVAIRLLN